MKRVELYIDTPIGPPFSSGAAVVNTGLKQALERAGCLVKANAIERLPFPANQCPLEEAARVAQLRSKNQAALRIFCTRPLDLIGPDALTRGSNAVFFHGFGYNPSAYLQNPNINAFLVNSRYMMQVLKSLLLYPVDLRKPSFNLPRPVLVDYLALVAPCNEYPRGFPGSGERLPASLLQGHGQCVFGHALRPGKSDPIATLAILYHLNRSGPARKRCFKLVIHQGDWSRFKEAAKSFPVRISLEDLLIPVAFLRNTDLYRLMRRCSFSLAYDIIPESFGLYILDSIFNATPLYTNGIGNLRHILPAGHGLCVFESASMYFGRLERRIEAYRPVAAAIMEDVESGRGAAACKEGRRCIQERYSRRAMDETLGKFLRLTRAQRSPAPLDLGRLEFSLGPLVRSWEQRSGKVLSDYINLRLPPYENDLLKNMIGKPLRHAKSLSSAREKSLLELFRLGVVAIERPHGG